MPHRDINIINEFEKSVVDINPKGHRNVMICGDFNCPDINWDHGYTYDNAPQKNVKDKLIDIKFL